VDCKIKRPFLWEKHLQFSPALTNFFGWQLPLNYQEGILKEAKNTRIRAALFDTSHMGRIVIYGEDRFKFLDKLITNNLPSNKRVCYSLLLDEKAKIIDDLTVYNGENFLLCVVNASNREKVLEWFNLHKERKISIYDDTFESCFFSIQGPESSSLLERLLKDSLDSLGYMDFGIRKIEGIEVIISRSGYTGEDGFELYVKNKFAEKLWDLIFEEGEKIGLSLAGLGARDILRVEAGYPLYGNEINLNTHPFEANLGWVVKYKDKEFIGKESILKILKTGWRRKRIGFIMQEKAFPRKGYIIYDKDEKEEIGEVTSGIYSPNLEKFIGMGYIKKDYAFFDNLIKIKIRDRFCLAQITKLPFINYRRKIRR